MDEEAVRYAEWVKAATSFFERKWGRSATRGALEELPYADDTSTVGWEGEPDVASGAGRRNLSDHMRRGSTRRKGW